MIRPALCGICPGAHHRVDRFGEVVEQAELSSTRMASGAPAGAPFGVSARAVRQITSVPGWARSRHPAGEMRRWCRVGRADASCPATSHQAAPASFAPSEPATPRVPRPDGGRRSCRPMNCRAGCDVATIPFTRASRHLSPKWCRRHAQCSTVDYFRYVRAGS